MPIMKTFKTTVELDEEKLERIMSLMHFTTRKEAIDWALTEAERIAVMNDIRSNPWSASVLRDAIEDDYDVTALRRREVRYKGKGDK
jgi:hypothetical protein